jgi:helix-turn-helix, Psq domain
VPNGTKKVANGTSTTGGRVDVRAAIADAAQQQGTTLEPEEISLAVDWLRLNPPAHPLPLETARELAAREIGIPGGKAGPGRGHKTQSNGLRLMSSNRKAYTLARLKRDRPDLAEQVVAGELSANAAAIEAGMSQRKAAKALGVSYETIRKDVTKGDKGVTKRDTPAKRDDLPPGAELTNATSFASSIADGARRR